jgi:hypothetical protein
MRIVSFKASNYKRLKVVEIKPDGTEVQISGRNGSGKTSVMDAIEVTLQGVEGAAPKPIREGADYAAIDLDVEDFNVRRTFAADGSTNLIITGKDGVRYPGPTAMAKAWWSKIGCDPLSFMRQKPEDQVEELKTIISFDSGELDAKLEKDTEERTDANRTLKQLKAQLAGMELPLGELPKKAIDTAALAQKLQESITHNEAVNVVQRQIELLQQQAVTAISNAHARRAHINGLLAQIKEDEAAEAAAVKEAEDATRKAMGLKAHEPIDTAALAEEMRNADATNAQIRKRDARLAIVQQQDELTAKVEKLTASIKAADDVKRKAVAKAKLPIRGLSLEGKQILLNGIPLQQTSSSDQIKVAMAIAMAKKPELRIVRIEEGSLLDDDSKQVIFEMARKANFQVWMEVVDTSGEVGIVLEDGMVKKVNPVGAKKGKGKK